jgi:hypothetical protein
MYKLRTKQQILGRNFEHPRILRNYRAVPLVPAGVENNVLYFIY